MNLKLKTILSATLIATMLLGMLVALPTFAAPGDADLKVEDSITGLQNIDYDINTLPPGPTAYVTINISVYAITGMAAWQINVTWDPLVLTIVNVGNNADISVPSDNVFGTYADIVDPTVDNVLGNAFQMVGIKSGGPTSFTGSGRLCQIKFHVLVTPTPINPIYTSPIHLTLQPEYPIYTSLVNEMAEDIPYNPFDGTFTYIYTAPVLPKPYLEWNPTGITLGNGVTWPKLPVGTTFNMDVVISNNVDIRHELILIQFAVKYNTTYFTLVDPGTGNNATEGNFMNNVAWAPYGTDFFTNYGGYSTSTKMETQYVLIMVNPNETTGEYDWGTFPVSTGLPVAQRVICTFQFMIKGQELKPWMVTDPNAFQITYMFPSMPGNMFLNSFLDWLENDQTKFPAKASFTEYGYILAQGLQLDVYTQHVIGGQGFNATSDGFAPQATVYLYANLTYNGDAVQNKPVAFNVYNGAGINFTKTAITNEFGQATINFGIEWPCTGAEDWTFGTWEVDATTTVREMQANDTTWFKVYWDTYNLKVSYIPPATKGTIVTFTVEWESFLMHYESVLIHLVVMDNLRVPIATASIWVTIGNPDLVWCTSEAGSVTLEAFIPKWAFVGLGEIEVSVLSDFPSNGGVPLCPEATAVIDIVKA